MSLNDLRRCDYSLDDDMIAIRDLFEDFFASEVPTSRVRAAEPLGFDERLWHSLTTVGAMSMGLPKAVNGDEVTLAGLTLLAEPFGAKLAPVPLLSQLVSSRLLAATGVGSAKARSVVEKVMSGEAFVGMAAEPVVTGRRQLIPDGALTQWVVGMDGDDLALFGPAAPEPAVPNQAVTPTAWWSPDTVGERIVLCSGGQAIEAIAVARAELAILTAAALVGMTQTALDLTCEFVRTRRTLGVPIGSLQGVSFPLCDVAINLDGTRNLARRAAWTLEHEPSAGRQLAYAVLAAATRTATHGTTTSVHMQGGLGFMVEADVSLYFLRSKGWAAAAGNPDAALSALGRARLAAAASASPSTDRRTAGTNTQGD